MLLAQNLPSYFSPSDEIAVDTPVIMRQTMKISIPLIFTNYPFKMGLEAQTWLLWLEGPRTLAETSEIQHSARKSAKI
jgi:hypothetical protein